MCQEEDKQYLTEFGLFIQEHRKAKKLSQTEVASLIGITQTYYSLIELGRRNIGFTLAIKICQSLEIDIRKFIASQKKKTPQPK